MSRGRCTVNAPMSVDDPADSRLVDYVDLSDT
ncbi:MAG: hypothetical protein QOJ71_1585, partial [Actinomycetota bacterium]|nr:hypothetical protein [Actinomycetota bacterium]